jgi:hypothetical protein
MARRSELLPLAHIRSWVFRFLTDGRDEMLRLPSELADTLAAEADPLKVKVVLEAAMQRVLDKFAQLDRNW